MSFKGRGLYQLTGRNSMPNISINGGSGLSALGAIGSGSTTSQHTITTPWQNLNSVQTISIGDLFKPDNSKYIKKYEILESVEDILVLSCVWYRMRGERNKGLPVNMPSKLTDNVLFESIKPEDREFATKIRDHYSKKIMMLKLKDVKLTPFRQDLNNFIHSDGTKVKEEMCGLAYRLPEFYDYDIKFDEMVKDCKKEIKPTGLSHQQHTLTPLGTLNVNHRREKKRVEYWFKDESNEIACINIDPNNPLFKVWNRVASEPIRIEGRYGKRNRDTVEYNVVTNYSLV